MYHLAQANYSRWIQGVTAELIEDFASQVPAMNQLAESSPGFVWRFENSPDNADVIAVFKDIRIIFNMSVWQSLEHLKQFAFQAPHNKIMLQRQTWFERPTEKTSVLWWMKAGEIPSLDLAKEKLDSLNRLGPTSEAFSFNAVFEPQS